MRSKKEIEKAMDILLSERKTPLSGMTYEQGVDDALSWVLEELSDEEFYYDYTKME